MLVCMEKQVRHIIDVFNWLHRLNFFKMNNKLNQFLFSFALVLVASFCSLVIAFAGNLTPPAGSPSPTMFSLEQIYNSLTGTGYDSSGFSPNADGNIHEQLKYIAASLENPYGDSNPEFVASTANLPGTLLANTFNGTNTPGTFPGGSYATGGVDDYNSGGSPPGNRYNTSWTPCNSGNSWCGLGVNGENMAKVKDNITGLVWSFACLGVNCASFDDSSPDGYNHATALANCSSGAHGKSGWTLPHQKHFLQAYINGSYGNVEVAGLNRYYWSATVQSTATGNGWRVSLSRGDASGINRTTGLVFVRCIHLAP